jgi:NADP-dependent 3-hydroxy acid dehydrogenase YdfG
MIVITGASDGLGKEVAKLYKEAGKTVVNISRRECEYADVNICHSLREGEEIQQIADEVLALDEPLEALINSAGVISVSSIKDITEEEIKRMMSTNIKGKVLLISKLYDRIVADKTDIVNVSSTLGHKAYEDQMLYGITTWGIRGLSKNLQLEFKGKPNRIISFCPGGFRTQLREKATGKKIENPEEWMRVEDVALALKQTLDLPKNMEVSEIVINRK